MSDTFKSGDVFAYPYLWHWQNERGEKEGRKSRPCCMALAAQGKDNRTMLFIVAITSKRPSPDRHTVAIPPIEARRAGLSTDIPLWVILDEINVDILEQSYTLASRNIIGSFGPAFTRTLLEKVRDQRRKNRLKAISRT